MKFDFTELRDMIDDILEEYVNSRENAVDITAEKAHEARMKSVGTEVPFFSYGVYHYRLFSNDCDFCFYQWRTEQCFNFSVGDFIESDIIGERSEGRWLIKSISYNIEPDEDIMIDINVEFEPY